MLCFIIVLTSNLGYKEEMFHKKGVGFAPESGSLHDVNNAISKHFRPEFINRIDEIIYFNPLDEETSLLLANKYYRGYSKNLTKKIIISEEELKSIIKNFIKLHRFWFRKYVHCMYAKSPQSCPIRCDHMDP